MQTTETAHIWLDDKGVAWIDNTKTKVIYVVQDQMLGFTAEQIHEQHPHLSLAQIYAALAYYYDHKEELDADIERREKVAEELISTLESPELLQQLKERRQKAI